MAKEMQIALPTFVDNPDIPESFADGFAGVSFTNGILKLTFTTVRADHSKDPAQHHRTVTVRLAIPITTALELQNGLANMMKELERMGVLHIQQPGPMTIQ
jgi:hypothetical protein